MIFIAYNGWMGNGSVAVIVEADNEHDAIIEAIEAFRAETPAYADDSYSHVKEIEQIDLPYFTEIG
jgi:hypothetical protein